MKLKWFQLIQEQQKKKRENSKEKQKKKVIPKWNDIKFEDEITGQLLCSFVLERLNISRSNPSDNKYKVKVGTTLEFWEGKGWITKYNPYGWVHWYCDFFSGKRSSEDRYQIERWKSYCVSFIICYYRLILLFHFLIHSI